MFDHWYHNTDKGIGDLAGLLGGPTEAGPTKRWIYGIAVAAVPIAYGIWGLVHGGTILYGRGGALRLKGSASIAMSLAYLAVGLFLHCHFFWSSHKKLWRAAGVAKALSAILFIVSIGFVVYKAVLG